MKVEVGAFVAFWSILVAAQFTGWDLVLKAVFGLVVWIWILACCSRYRDLPWLLVLIGAGFNTAVIVANGGYMPVANCTLPVCFRPSSWWRPSQPESRLAFWGDWLPPLESTSLGDWIVFAGAGLLVARIVAQWRG